MKNFQMIILVVFVGGAIVGLLVFAGIIPLGKKTNTSAGTVTLWGTIPNSLISDNLNKFGLVNTTFVLKYVQKDPATFDQELLEAIASGTGPDMFILPDNLILHYKDRIMPIPYTSYPLASFKTNFVSASDVYLNTKGVLALPIAVDPLIMYYNRSIFDANGVVNPPNTWDGVQSIAPVITKKTQEGQIIKSAIAFGQSSNIVSSKEILATLFMQTGNPVVKNNGTGYLATLANAGAPDLVSTLNFYTSFADPTNSVYSWNKGLPNSRDMFAAGNLGIYFGFGSELSNMTTKNPNLNFYIAPVPQIKDAQFKTTFAHTYGIAVSAYSKNVTTALNAAGLLTSSNFADTFSKALLMAPARRDLLAVRQTDEYMPVIYGSALYSQSFLDPASANTNVIFQRMVENVLSNNLSADSSLLDASNKLQLLLPN